MLDTRIAVTGLAAAHFAVTAWHGAAHGALAIGLPPSKNAFVYTVIVAAPLVAAALVWTRHDRVGLRLFSAALLGALLFGVYHHYVLVSPDNVHHLPAGSAEDHAAFTRSAAALALVELAALLYGVHRLGACRADA